MCSCLRYAIPCVCFFCASARHFGDNQTLSEHRADAVKRCLVAQETDAGRIAALGARAPRPIRKGVTEEDHQPNRRVELNFMPEGCVPDRCSGGTNELEGGQPDISHLLRQLEKRLGAVGSDFANFGGGVLYRIGEFSFCRDLGPLPVLDCTAQIR
jgi:OmpA family protein